MVWKDFVLIVCGDPAKENHKSLKINGPEEILVYGEHKKEIDACLDNNNKKLFNTLEDIISYLKDSSKKNILFSPGYPSGKDYKNFEIRGEHFNSCLNLQMNRTNNFLILFSFISLMSLGFIMVASSSIYVADEMTGDPFYFASRQLIFISVGLFVMSIFLLLPSDFLFKSDWVFMLISILLLIALFIPDIGTSVNGSIRWIRLGPINIQPSEVCKFSLILYISGYSVRRMSEINTLRSFLKPLLLLFIISLLIMSQPDLGSTAIICLLVVAILFYAGISFFQFSLLSILISLLGYLAISSSPMRLARVLAFTDPFAEDVVRNAGWQLSNSLISIGQGRVVWLRHR